MLRGWASERAASRGTVARDGASIRETRLRWGLRSSGTGYGLGKVERLAGIEGQREFAEQRLKRPARSQVDADRARGLADAGADFEQAGAQRFDLRRTPLRRELEQAKQVDEVVGEAVQEQAESIGQKAV